MRVMIKHKNGTENKSWWKKNELVGPVLMGIGVLLFGIIVGFNVHRFKTVQVAEDPMANYVWVEFSSVQHAADALGTLSKNSIINRDLQICVGSKVKSKSNLWLPPHVKINGNPEYCHFPSHVKFDLPSITATDDNTISYLYFMSSENENDSWFSGRGYVRDNWITHPNASN